MAVLQLGVELSLMLLSTPVVFSLCKGKCLLWKTPLNSAYEQPQHLYCKSGGQEEAPLAACKCHRDMNEWRRTACHWRYTEFVIFFIFFPQS